MAAVPAVHEIQGPFFAPLHRDDYYRILTDRYNAARMEAGVLGQDARISMRVVSFKPRHFNWTAGDYRLPTGYTSKTLKPNTAFFPAGIINNDPCFDFIKWWEGASAAGPGTRYIGDWFVYPVYHFRERQGAYKGNLTRYEYRANETFTMYVHASIIGTCTSPMADYVSAWMLAFCVLPSTEAEMPITTA